MALKLLFVCSKNRLRSPTAEAVFSRHPGVEAIGAGTNKDAPTPVTGDLIEWADVILVMEAVHRQRLNARFGRLLRGKHLAVLGIRDRYAYMEPDLVDLLRRRASRWLG